MQSKYIYQGIDFEWKRQNLPSGQFKICPVRKNIAPKSYSRPPGKARIKKETKKYAFRRGKAAVKA